MKYRTHHLINESNHLSKIRNILWNTNFTKEIFMSFLVGYFKFIGLHEYSYLDYRK